ncbi:DNA binding domain-containing protein, excisionase family [Methylobacterium phyllostachyos]|uniref:DNA binding domain-containing protein, excisionase family n=1 Tax=Methylobacterium phyllostachyos TaxID=582672 RepID=A0A1H0KKA4_9HYPH|nr:helix-turn-helix domain-containing protein [Methylobacterium phyllostachyos]SDO56190.1 DNA binding domain-containing protein, excisionase family [Methylobacterium phyllostachyos]
MPEPDLLTADEAAELLRISRRTLDGHVARGDIAYISVGLGEKRTRKRFDPADIDRFRERQRRVEAPPPATPSCRRRKEVPAVEIVDFKALLEERRAARRTAREAAQKATRRSR